SDNVVMLYLLVVIGAAVCVGRWPAILASVLAYLAIDWFFVCPRSLFTAGNPGELLTLVAFVVTAASTGQLTATLRARERQTAVLAETSWTVASQLDR